MPLPIIEPHALAAIMPEAVIAAARDALIRHARGEVVAPPPVQLQFESANGDLHVKAGRYRDGAIAVVKLASGFYDNPQRGLPVNDGLMVVIDAITGAPIVLVRDHGLLTSWRTAAAGALAAEAGALPGKPVLGIVGTGHQARLQAQWIARHLDLAAARIFGRTPDHAADLAASLRAQGLDAQPVRSIEALTDACRLIVTCTPSRKALLQVGMIRPGTHIVALGADTPGKQELDPALFARADEIWVDDRAQCADHGDLSYAIEAGFTSVQAPRLLGEALAEATLTRDTDAVTIADLTGIAALDIAMATLALATGWHA